MLGQYFFVIDTFLGVVCCNSYNYYNHDLIDEYGLSAYFTDDLRELLNQLPTKNNADCIDIIANLYDQGGEFCQELYENREQLEQFILATSHYLINKD